MNRRTFLTGLIAFTGDINLNGINNIYDLPRIVIDEWPPYEYTSENLILGSSYDIATHALKALGYDKFHTRTNIPWARGIEILKNKEADILLSGIWTKERENLFYIPPTTVGCLRWGVHTLGYKYKRKNNRTTVGLVNGYEYPKPLLEKVKDYNKIYTVGDENLVKLLLYGRVDYILADERSINNYYKDIELRRNLITTNVFISPLFLMINPDWELREEFTKKLQEMEEEGIIKNINHRYNLICPNFENKLGFFEDKRND